MGELLRTNGNCSSPCIWGIIPNQTTLAEARNFLLTMDQILDLPSGYPKEFRFKNQDGSLGHVGAGGFTVQNGVITGIELFVTYNISGTARSDWTAFTPEGIFNAYGVPSEIRFWLIYDHDTPPPGEDFTYWTIMLLFYNNISVSIVYDFGLTERKGDFYRYCPAPVDSPSVGIGMRIGKDVFHHQTDDAAIRLEDAASLSRQEFYQLITENPGTACIDLKAEAFKDQ